MLNGPDFKARPHLAGLRAKDLGQRQQTKIVQQKISKKLKLCNKKLAKQTKIVQQQICKIMAKLRQRSRE